MVLLTLLAQTILEIFTLNFIIKDGESSKAKRYLFFLS
jgi:hypothetical protein